MVDGERQRARRVDQQDQLATLHVGEGERIDGLVRALRPAYAQPLARLEPGVVGIGGGRDQREVAEGIDG